MGTRPPGPLACVVVVHVASLWAAQVLLCAVHSGLTCLVMSLHLLGQSGLVDYSMDEVSCLCVTPAECASLGAAAVVR